MTRRHRLVVVALAIAAVSLASAPAVAIAAPRGAASKRAPAAPPARARALEAEIARLDAEARQLTIKQANFAVAKLERKILALQLQLNGPDSPQVEARKQRLAGVLGQIGDHAGQLAIHKELLARAERLHGPESRETMYALMALIAPYIATQRHDEVETVQQRVLALTRKLEGETSAGYAMQLSQYAGLLTARGQYASASLVYEQALKIQEALQQDEAKLLGPVQALAGAYWYANQHAKATAMFDRALEITKRPGTPVITRGSTLWMVFSFYHYGGRDDLARPVSKLAIDLYEAETARLARDAPDDPSLSSMLGQLGFAYRETGDFASAERVFDRVIAMDIKRSGFSGWAAVLADIKRVQGKLREALALLEAAQDGLRKMAPNAGYPYNSLIADVARELGDYPRAQRLLVDYRADLLRTYGKNHPLYGAAELSTAYLHMAMGQPAVAEQLLTDGLELAERDLQAMLRTGTEADHAAYFSKNSHQLDIAINFQLHYAAASASAARLGLTTLLRRKGRVLDAAATNLTSLRARLSPADKQLLDELASARAQLARLTVAGPAATGEASFLKEVAAYEAQIQRLEIQIGKNSAAYRAASQPIQLAAVQKAIPRDARLVEIVNFQPSDPKAGYRINQVMAPRRYAAYVVGRTGDPVLIDLGPAAAIDDAVDAFRKAVSDPDNDRAPELGQALYALTLAKIAPALGGASHVLIAPDGALNVVPFAALVDDKGRFLIQRYLFTYLTSGRDLLRLGIKARAQGGGAVFADPAFDAAGPARPAPGQSAPTTRGRRSAELTLQAWKPLPATAQEADAVVRHLRDVAIFRGRDATETQLKRIRSPRVLHLATHGFFLRDEPPPPPGEAAAAVPAASAQIALAARENPLLRSGLALAGANQLTSGNDDGILTALEAAGLDLWGTELVVLSACETGVGKVTNGDGVYGLRRALVIAGAESLLMSLWQVDDVATRDLMAGYYARLTRGAPRSTALRDIQLEIQRMPKYAHPYYWASFLSAGDNTPITPTR